MVSSWKPSPCAKGFWASDGRVLATKRADRRVWTGARDLVPSVATAFSDSEAVNTAVRVVIAVARTVRKTGHRSVRAQPDAAALSLAYPPPLAGPSEGGHRWCPQGGTERWGCTMPASPGATLASSSRPSHDTFRGSGEREARQFTYVCPTMRPLSSLERRHGSRKTSLPQ